MRIGLIDLAALDYSPHTPSERPLGGMQSGLGYLAMALADRGHEVTLVNRTSTPGVYSGVKSLHIDEGFRPDKLQQFDVVVSISCAGLALRDAGLSAPLVLWTGHNGDEPSVQKLIDPAERSAWTRIVLKSEWQKSVFQERFDLEPWRAGVIGNAISPSVERTPPTRDFYFENDRPPVLLYSSAPFRGLDVLLRAFPAIGASVPGSTARIYASMAVYQKDGENDEYHALYERCRRLSGVEYYGSVNQPALAAALSQADILSFPSTYAETSCVTVMEAMASGCIVVCSDLGALRETSAGFGYLMPYPPAVHVNLRAALFTSALLQAVADSRREPAAMRRRLEDQIAFARSNYVWSARAEQWESYLLDLLDSQRSAVLSSERKTGDPPSFSFTSVRGATGQEIFVDPQDERGRRLVKSGGNFNPIALAAWHRLLKEDQWTHVIDVGANYGEMLLNGSLPPEANIIAIEPNPKIIPYLRKTLSHLNKVKLLEVAVADKVGEVDFEINENWSGMSRIVSEGVGHIRVPTLTLNDVLLDAGRPANGVKLLLKVDVEGQELNVIRTLDLDSEAFSNIAILIEIAHLTETDIDWIFARYDVFGLTLEDGQFEALRRSDVGQLAASGRWDQDVVLRRRPFSARVEPHRDVAFVTVCKGRLHHIRETLPLIVAQAPGEIVVVDYGCPQKVGDWVEANFASVRVVRVADDLGFSLSRGRNLGALNTSSPLICFMDADAKIAPGFVDWIRANADTRHFYRHAFIDKEGDKQAYGTFVCPREVFDAVGGFDEVFRGWGGGGDDIVSRMIRFGALQAEYPVEFVNAISHGDQDQMPVHVQENLYLQNIINLFYKKSKAAAIDFLKIPLNGDLDIKIRREIDKNVRSAISDWVANPSGLSPQVTLNRIFNTGLNDEYGLKHDVTVKLELFKCEV